MAFQNKTLKEVYDITVNGFKEEFNTSFRLLPKSFINVLAKVIAGVFMVCYKMVGWVVLQIYPDTADYTVVNILGKKINPLGAWGNLIGSGDPKPATAFVGVVDFNVLGNGVVSTGAQFKSEVTNKVYLATETIVINKEESTTVSIPVECVDSGIVGNLDIGDEVKLVNPLGFISSKGVVSSITASANDGESISSYRHRIVTRWKTHPQGGSLADYRAWSFDVEGVYQTYIYNDDNSATGVIIYVCADEEATGSRIANSGMLKAVGLACTYDPETGRQDRKPLTAVLDPRGDESFENVKSISEVIFDVYINGFSGNAEEIKNNAKTSIESYLKGREPYIRGLSIDNERNDGISVNNVVGIVNEIAIAATKNFESITIRKNSQDIQSYTLGRGELAVLGNLYINGVAV